MIMLKNKIKKRRVIKSQKVKIVIFFILSNAICFSQSYKSISQFSKTVNKVGYYDNSHTELDACYIELYSYLGDINSDGLRFKIITRISMFAGKTTYDLCFYGIENNEYYHFRCDLLKQLPISIDGLYLVFYNNKKILFRHQTLSKVFNTPYGDSLFPE